MSERQTERERERVRGWVAGWVGGWVSEWEGIVEGEGRCMLGTPRVWDDMPWVKHPTKLFSSPRDSVRAACGYTTHSSKLTPHFVLLQTV